MLCILFQFKKITNTEDKKVYKNKFISFQHFVIEKIL